jgi:hypothetical protein
VIEIVRYAEAKFEQANDDYLKMEEDNNGNQAVEVVLVSIQDVKKLSQSYPNYFMDTTEFINNLKLLFQILVIIIRLLKFSFSITNYFYHLLFEIHF